MHWRTGYAIVCYQLAVGITFYMVLISEMSFAVLLCPVCVYVFLSEFTFVFGLFPLLGNHTVFDFFVLVPAVSLSRCVNECCVNYRTFVLISPLFSRCSSNIQNNLSTVSVSARLFLNFQIVFASGTFSHRFIPRNLIKLILSLIWYSVWSSDRLYSRCYNR